MQACTRDQPMWAISLRLECVPYPHMSSGLHRLETPHRSGSHRQCHLCFLAPLQFQCQPPCQPDDRGPVNPGDVSGECRMAGCKAPCESGFTASVMRSPVTKGSLSIRWVHNSVPSPPSTTITDRRRCRSTPTSHPRAPCSRVSKARVLSRVNQRRGGLALHGITSRANCDQTSPACAEYHWERDWLVEA